jgi:hypothetical protein
MLNFNPKSSIFHDMLDTGGVVHAFNTPISNAVDITQYKPDGSKRVEGKVYKFGK